ncbi:MAG: outer membrane protein assembly factor BamD [Methylobacter sp.]|nr:MAG: outer membrane protein assembly factor BamD [Methylobacter sp.]
MRLKFFQFIFTGVVILALSGCETFQSTDSNPAAGADEYAEWNAEKFGSEAKKALETGNYEKSIKLLETLEARFPFSDYATQAQLDVAYAYYKNDDAESALAAADRFIKINPRSPSIDYAYYLKGLINFNRGIGFIDRYLPTDITQRDQSTAREAFDNFSELLRRFPASKYIPDAKQRMISLKNNLAMHEIHIAEHYMETRCYVAALDRATNVIEKYQQTPAVPKALEIMQEAYTQMNMTAQADDTARVYQLNFPEGQPESEQANRTVSNRIWDFIGLED